MRALDSRLCFVFFLFIVRCGLTLLLSQSRSLSLFFFLPSILSFSLFFSLSVSLSLSLTLTPWSRLLCSPNGRYVGESSDTGKKTSINRVRSRMQMNSQTIVCQFRSIIPVSLAKEIFNKQKQTRQRTHGTLIMEKGKQFQ